MRRFAGAAFIVLALMAGGWWGYGRTFATYSPEEERLAEDAVNQYYAHLMAGEYGQALALAGPPADQVRDWAYERQWRSQELQRLAESGEYRMVGLGGTELVGGPPHKQPKRQPLTFYATMYVEMGGQKDMIAENLTVQQVDGHFRIVGFESLDRYVRYRAFAYRLV